MVVQWGVKIFEILVFLGRGLLDPGLGASAEIRTGAPGLPSKSNIVKSTAGKTPKRAETAVIIT